jgi:hypothetical protein
MVRSDEDASILARMAMNDRERRSGRRELDTWRTRPTGSTLVPSPSSAFGVSAGLLAWMPHGSCDWFDSLSFPILRSLNLIGPRILRNLQRRR